MSGNVAFIRPDIFKKLPIYELIDDCIEQLVKSKGAKYLPRPNAEDKSKENIARYDAYLTRAVFYNVTGRTLNGLVGQAFASDPLIEVPDLIKPILIDANGKNITLVQSAKETLEYVLSKGRCGLFVDYPVVSEAATRRQLLDGEIKPTINIYAPGMVINWDFKKIGGKQMLSLVVLKEIVQVRVAGDKFELKEQEQYRVLELDDQNNYIQSLYTIVVDGNGNPARDKGNFTFEVLPENQFQIIDSEGVPLKELPFTFVGSVNNDPGVDPAPLENLSEINIAHYRNSADYEESSYMVGQPTYVVSGLTADWLKNQLKGVIQVGSRGGLPLPVGATAEILQPSENAMPMEAMKHKEEQMVAIGAKLVQSDKSAAQTATAANIENTSETSILATGCKNVSAAYLFALQICAKMTGADIKTIKFEINTDFAITGMSSEEQTALIASWQGGAITFSEMREKLRESGLATLDDDEAKKELDADQAKKDDQAASAAKKLADAVPPAPIVGNKNTA